MATTLPAKPDQRPSEGELLTYTTFCDIGLWLSYTVDDGQVIVEKAWINGEWVDAYALFGEPQYLAWCNAAQADIEADARSLAECVIEALPRFDAALARAEMRRAA